MVPINFLKPHIWVNYNENESLLWEQPVYITLGIQQMI